ncbi:MAG: lysostaphin resistance A-like protein [Promethearchaeota archaeon]
MNEKKVNSQHKEEDYNNSKNNKDRNHNQKDWLFCPICGADLPKIKNLKFCIKCRTNITYLKEHKKFPPTPPSYRYTKTIPYRKFSTPDIIYGIEKIPDEKITDTRDLKLWGITASLSIPLGAYVLMNILVTGLLVVLMFFIYDLDSLIDLMLNPYFLIFSSFFELVFILLPVIYVGKYLQKPSLENRLILLGFTFRGYNKKGISKEILIGLGFALVGIVLVIVSSVFIEILLEIIFGVDIVRDVSGSTSDVEMIVSSIDILGVILFAIVMILIIGTSEEVIFRGFMQKGLSRNLGKIWGLIITAFIFSMIHLFGIFLIAAESPLTIIISFLLSFIPYFSISLMLGWLYYWRNENLIAVMITHGFYDAITIILAFILYGMF